MEGVRAYSHLHGLLPRLGFFVGNESRIPYDFDEMIASIAPRPVLVIAPAMDKDANLEHVEAAVTNARSIYSLYNAQDKLNIFVPDDYSKFSPEMQEKAYQWLQAQLVNSSNQITRD